MTGTRETRINNLLENITYFQNKFIPLKVTPKEAEDLRYIN